MTTLASYWSAIWPNLAADVIWTVPLWLWHHSRLNRILDEHTRTLREHLGIDD